MHAQNGRCDQGSDGGKKEQGKRSLARQLTSQTRGGGVGHLQQFQQQKSWIYSVPPTMAHATTRLLFRSR